MYDAKLPPPLPPAHALKLVWQRAQRGRVWTSAASPLRLDPAEPPFLPTTMTPRVVHVGSSLMVGVGATRISLPPSETVCVAAVHKVSVCVCVCVCVCYVEMKCVWYVHV